MKLIIGLGNPGEKYNSNRHNVGFMLVDNLGEKLNIANWESSKKGKARYTWAKVGQKRIELLKPQTFMNESGFSVRYVKTKHQNLKSSEMYVVHDDLDIQLGYYKIQFGRGPREHGGINSIEKAIKSKNFWRVRIGIDNRKPEDTVSGEEYVLQDFSADELTILKEVFDKLAPDLFKHVRQ